METFFLVCTILGGTLVVCQVVAGLFGFGAEADHDIGHDGGDFDHGNVFVSMLSVRALTAALMFVGLGGLTALQYGADELTAAGIAAAAGIATLAAVGGMMRAIAQLKHDGTIRVERSIGRTGTVYLRIPAARAGAGKVHLMLQNRTVEYQAVTVGAELPTGAPVRVVAVVNSDTVEVEAA
jgi:hypothetical protein